MRNKDYKIIKKMTFIRIEVIFLSFMITLNFYNLNELLSGTMRLNTKCSEEPYLESKQ